MISKGRPSQPLKWHGGKHYLAQRIIKLIPAHIHYDEPFFGGGAVLLAKPAQLVEGHSELANDVHGELINFWRVLQCEDSFAKFGRCVEAVPLARAEWERAIQSTDQDPISRASRSLCISPVAARPGQRLCEDVAHPYPAGNECTGSSWLSAVDGLSEAHRRLQRVVIDSDDAIRVIRREDGPDTFFYCDPPYLQ